ncbi:AzlD domain-containing protein [Jannaschia sp. 2305UL9-9]|uniref:AzlD domain-containing protein n=1 Tax=Jannaschia sp. 2305UL9-9 TaxID=3121638 RepID=UPI003528B34E
MTDTTVWIVIAALGIGTYLSRFAFLGLIGDREMPAWVLRHLRYTGVAVLPGLVAPLVVWPDATGGEVDPLRLASAAVTLAVGAWRRDTIQAVIAGGLFFGIGNWLL